MKLKDLFVDSFRWIQHDWAQSEEGAHCSFDHPNAVRFCLVGGINKCYPDINSQRSIRVKIEKYIDNLESSAPIMVWNDSSDRTFQDILDLINKLDI